MSIFTPTRQPEFCKTCHNRGYYHLGILVKDAPNLGEKKTMAFCACDIGRQLYQISIDFRFADLKAFSDPLLKSLRECENRWRDREQARKILRQSVLELEKLVTRLEEEANKKL